MARIKGTPKTGGRVKGSLNKQTAELRSFVAELIEYSQDKIKDDIDKLDAGQRLMYFEKLLQYVLPKPKPADFPLEAGLTHVIHGSTAYVITTEERDEMYD